MKMIKLNCPDCGAQLTVEKDRDQIFCMYCGNKILIAPDFYSKQDININANFTNTNIDYSEIQREQEKTERLETFLSFLLIIFLFLFLGMMVFFKYKTK